jgi:hypothetical protein
MGEAVDVLLRQMDAAYAKLVQRVDELDEDEFFWKPVPDAWTLRWMPDGRWSYDYAFPDPDPAPVTTIAWRLNHIATCKVMYHEYAFGPQELTFPSLVIPQTVPVMMAFLEEGQQLLVEDLSGLRDEELEAPRLTNWGEEWPTWKIFWTMIDHDAWHGGEIGALRDLYRVTRSA